MSCAYSMQGDSLLSSHNVYLQGIDKGRALVKLEPSARGTKGIRAIAYAGGGLILRWLSASWRKQGI